MKKNRTFFIDQCWWQILQFVNLLIILFCAIFCHIQFIFPCISQCNWGMYCCFCAKEAQIMLPNKSFFNFNLNSCSTYLPSFFNFPSCLRWSRTIGCLCLTLQQALESLCVDLFNQNLCSLLSIDNGYLQRSSYSWLSSAFWNFWNQHCIIHSFVVLWPNSLLMLWVISVVYGLVWNRIRILYAIASFPSGIL